MPVAAGRARELVFALVVGLLVPSCADQQPRPAPASRPAVLFPTGATFGSGWSYEETDGELTYRWMGARGDVRLGPPRRWSTMRLFLELHVPLELLARAPRIRVLLDGRELDAFDALTADNRRAYLIRPTVARQGVEPELVLETSDTASAGRTVGLALMRASWDPVGGAE